MCFLCFCIGSFFLFVLFCLIIFIILDARLHSNEKMRERERNGVDLGWWGSGESLRRVGGRENIIRMFYMKNMFLKNGKNERLLKKNFFSK